jgi:hypothetical protein
VFATGGRTVLLDGGGGGGGQAWLGEKKICCAFSLSDPCSVALQTRCVLKIARPRMLQVQDDKKFCACKRFPPDLYLRHTGNGQDEAAPYSEMSRLVVWLQYVQAWYDSGQVPRRNKYTG